jgi:hypothetical protein
LVPLEKLLLHKRTDTPRAATHYSVLLFGRYFAWHVSHVSSILSPQIGKCFDVFAFAALNSAAPTCRQRWKLRDGTRPLRDRSQDALPPVSRWGRLKALDRQPRWAYSRPFGCGPITRLVSIRFCNQCPFKVRGFHIFSCWTAGVHGAQASCLLTAENCNLLVAVLKNVVGLALSVGKGTVEGFLAKATRAGFWALLEVDVDSF